MKLLEELQVMYTERKETDSEYKKRKRRINGQIANITGIVKRNARNGRIKTTILNEGILPEVVEYFERENLIVWVNSESIIIQIPLAS